MRSDARCARDLDAGPKTDFTSTTLALGQWIVWLVYLPVWSWCFAARLKGMKR